MKKFDFEKFEPMPKFIWANDMLPIPNPAHNLEPYSKTFLVMPDSIAYAEPFKALINRPDVRKFTFYWHKDRTGVMKYGPQTMDEPYGIGARSCEAYFEELLKAQEKKEQYGYLILQHNGYDQDGQENAPTMTGWTVLFNLENGLAEGEIWLDPAYSRQGLGPMVMRTLYWELSKHGIDKFTMTSIAGNRMAASMARKMGFMYVGKIKNYADNPIIESDDEFNVVRRAYDQDNYLKCPETDCPWMKLGRKYLGR
ncbi:MAG: GNAT family N-acetyltransferase [Rickettsiales bacterium]|jgi:ribosomal protein S18 acetylase RimI-like enzyme|nr:GNAT family N-acetyltransferase [Rickettsiales bacterium]